MKYLKNKYLIAVALLLIIITLIVKFFKSRPTDKNLVANGLLNAYGLEENHKNRLNNTALQLAHYLGTAYHWSNPQYYTEEDDKAFNLLYGLNQQDFDLISELYFNIYAKGRTLKVDLAKLLDSKYYEQLTIK